jgi:hypothetical protein
LHIKVVYHYRVKLAVACICVLVLLLAACSRSNNLFLGRVETTLGTHTVVVTDCYRTTVPPPERIANGDFHYTPCRDAEVWIRGEELTVNGIAYGHLDPGDGVLVDHGKVSVDRRGKHTA